MVEIASFDNCFCDLTNDDNKKIPYKKFDNFYLKIKFSQLPSLFLNIKCNYLTLEIINITDLYEINYFYKFFLKHKVNRIVLTYKVLKDSNIDEKLPRYFLIKQIEEMKIDNLAIDFYLGNFRQNFLEKIESFLKHFPFLKHFSIYFDSNAFDGLLIKSKIFSFIRYHKHMWAKASYQATFDLIGHIEKNYLGIGKGVVSRLGDTFFNCSIQNNEWVFKKINHLNLAFIDFNDHIDRLNYYLELTDKELDDRYTQISKQAYKNTLKKYSGDIYITHDFLIEDLFNKNMSEI